MTEPLTGDLLPMPERREWLKGLIEIDARRNNLGPLQTHACVELGDTLLRDGYSASRALSRATDLAKELASLATVRAAVDRAFQ